MRVADLVANMLYDAGVRDVFLVTGGGLMFMTDGLACHQGLRAVPCLHEQAAAMAAIGYAQYRDGYGACYVTTGCGGTNTVTGVLHAWQDHIPVVYVSGQCNRNEMMTIAKSPVRAIGQQEADIVSIVRSITKYAVTIMEPEDALYHVEKALYLAKAGCQGPVWLDIPLDVQEAEVDLASARHFDPAEMAPVRSVPAKAEVDRVVAALEEAERPLLLLGAGVRYAGAGEAFARLAERYQIPYVATRRGWDICPKSDPLHIGLADIRGNRSANMAMQNADMLLVLGSRLSMFTTGYNYDLFARGAKQVIVVDIDEDEHRKGTVHLDQVINADVGEFLRALPELHMKPTRAWVETCRHWKEVFPVFTPEQQDDSHGMSKFAFIDRLNRHLKADSVVITDAGATTEIPMQGLYFTTVRQRYIGSAEQCEMGYALPASVGVCVAREKGEALCIVGDDEHPGIADLCDAKAPCQDLRMEQRRIRHDPGASEEHLQGPLPGRGCPERHGLPCAGQDRGGLWHRVLPRGHPGAARRDLAEGDGGGGARPVRRDLLDGRGEPDGEGALPQGGRQPDRPAAGGHVPAGGPGPAGAGDDRRTDPLVGVGHGAA